MRKNKMKVTGLVAAIAILGVSSLASAGKIISIPTPAASDTLYFGGWNLDNIEVQTFKEELTPGGDLIETDTPFIPETGAYDADYFSFSSFVEGTTAAATSTPIVMGVLHGKDYPVGEPSGIKVVNDDNLVKSPKPENCIVTTSYVDPNFLDTATPEQTICSSGFQTHKRFKVNMLDNSLDSNGGAVDLVFNVEPDGTTRDYQVFQKMNNYTGSRLEGYRLEVGTGVGAAFVKSTDTSPGSLINSLSIFASLKTDSDPETGIWEADELATFSHGLFGAADKHFPEDGFFDDQPAGYFVTPPVQGRGTDDTLTSGAAMPNHYTAVPVPNGEPITSQFGPWLHDEIAPSGVFFDDDNDPATDATLLAFWGDTGIGSYAWMFGNNHVPAFAEVDELTLNGWASNPVYFVDVIEDMLNLGLNYVVSIGTVDTSWPTWDAGSNSATFTIRMVPIKDTSGIGDPGYSEVENQAPPLEVTEIVGEVNVLPSPEFDVDESLTITIADGDATLPLGVVVENKTTGELESSTEAGSLIITAVEGRIGLFQGILLTSGDQIKDGGNYDGAMFVEPGDVIVITYSDTSPVGEDTAQTTVAGNTIFYVVPTPGGGAAVFNL